MPKELNAEQILGSYRRCFTGPNGEAVLADLIKQYVLNTGYAGDSHKSVYAQGERDVVLRILAIVYKNGDAAFDTLLSTLKKEKE